MPSDRFPNKIELAPPFRAGLALTITQGPGGEISHEGDLHLSWDFARTDGQSILGEPVLAVYDGTVAFGLDSVADGNDHGASVFPPAPGSGAARDDSLGPSGALGNTVTLRHEVDGEVFYSSYMHLADGAGCIAAGCCGTAISERDRPMVLMIRATDTLFWSPKAYQPPAAPPCFS